MELLQYTYFPKSGEIDCLQVSRQEGFCRLCVHTHAHHELVLVPSQSEFCVINNGKEITLTSPCVILNRAGTFHEVVKIGHGNYESRVIHFHPKVLASLPKELLYEEQLFSSDLLAIPLSPEQLKMLEELFTLIFSRPLPQKRPLLLTLFAALNGLLQEGAESARLNTAERYIFRVIDLVRNDQGNLTIAALSRTFHVCPTKLKSDFKRIAGMPVMTYRNLVRLNKAQSLLEETDMSVSRIAYTCGFSDESYFIRCFRKHYGTTPAAYRKSFML